MKKPLLMFSTTAIVAFAVSGCNETLDPISTVQSYVTEHNGKEITYAELLAQSGRCNNPTWSQELNEITWQRGGDVSDSIKVNVVCHSKTNLQLRQRFASELSRLDEIAKKVIPAEEFEKVRKQYEDRKSDKTPAYNEARLRELVTAFCHFPDPTTELTQFISEVSWPRGGACSPTEEQKKALETEFAFKYGSAESILWPFYEEKGVELAKNFDVEKVENAKQFDVEEKVTFTVQYRKKSARKFNKKYSASVGGNFYELSINGEVKNQRSHPNVLSVFTSPIAWN